MSTLCPYLSLSVFTSVRNDIYPYLLISVLTCVRNNIYQYFTYIRTYVYPYSPDLYLLISVLTCIRTLQIRIYLYPYLRVSVLSRSVL